MAVGELNWLFDEPGEILTRRCVGLPVFFFRRLTFHTDGFEIGPEMCLARAHASARDALCVCIDFGSMDFVCVRVCVCACALVCQVRWRMSAYVCCLRRGARELLQLRQAQLLKERAQFPPSAEG